MRQFPKSAAPTWGSGFDCMASAPAERRFRAWWNSASFFPVGGAEAEAIFTAPPVRRAA
jgi:hypothetical protein